MEPSTGPGPVASEQDRVDSGQGTVTREVTVIEQDGVATVAVVAFTQ